MRIKMIVGFRRDQEHSVDVDEAHKAYYLFLHPEERGVFSDGLAIKGSQIDEIVPDWQGTMGWNPTHTLDSDDWNEIRGAKVDKKIRKALAFAKNVAQLGRVEDLGVPLSELAKGKYAELMDSSAKLLELGNEHE